MRNVHLAGKTTILIMCTENVVVNKNMKPKKEKHKSFLLFCITFFFHVSTKQRRLDRLILHKTSPEGLPKIRQRKKNKVSFQGIYSNVIFLKNRGYATCLCQIHCRALHIKHGKREIIVKTSWHISNSGDWRKTRWVCVLVKGNTKTCQIPVK